MMIQISLTKTKKRILCLVIILLIVFGIIHHYRKASEAEFLAPPRSDVKSKGLGEGGIPVKIKLENLSEKERLEYETSSANITLNAFVSDRISVRRYLPDRRDDFCKKKTFRDLPDTSVIITFHNELYSLLLRTLHSVVDRSPPELIKEIILVDDGSDYDYINGKLQKYLETNFDKVKLIHTKSQLGLIKARLAGIEIATGETLTFLDSHVECLTGWLEPLLDEVKRDKRRIVEPSLPNISGEDFSIEKSEYPSVGFFNWKLEFGWRVPHEEITKNGNKNMPLKDPALVGGVFTINRDFFKSLGYWDDGLKLYGYENMELTFKAWMCHGSVYKIPCSVVAHVFHNRKIGNWKLQKKVLKRNCDRVAEVWLDDYKELVYQRTGPKSADLGDISHLLELRQKNRCRDFKWFLKNIIPQFADPMLSIRSDMVRNAASSLCLIPTPDYHLIGYPCTKPTEIDGQVVFSSAIWDMSREGYMCADNLCIYFDGVDSQLKVFPYHLVTKMEEFIYDPVNQSFRSRDLNRCIEINESAISTSPCKENAANQKWVWGYD